MTAEGAASNLSDLPAEMLEFTLIKSASALAPRLGRLSLPGRKPILTPDFIANTSRGAVPHISQDNFRKTSALNGVYVALEDFIEKHPQKTPPVFLFNTPDPLRKFIALPNDSPLIMGARRNPPTATPMSNSNTNIAMQTSVGYKTISSQYYADAVQKLQPDIVIGIADIPFGQENVGVKRRDKMADRTENWTRDLIAKRNSLGKEEKKFSIFAPFLPIDRDLQSWYLEHLVDEMMDHISGIAVYDAYLLDDLPEALAKFPRLSMHNPASPQELLRQVSLGVDVLTIPFVNEATDAGIALDFTFPAPKKSAEGDGATGTRRSLGVDMWPAELATSMTPLSEGCTCHSCTNHYRAYIQHLLAAKEMLGWVLIQLHNHETLSSFFAGVRASIEAGTFEQDVKDFEAYYEPQLPAKSGQGPRVRGYQFRAEEHGKPEKKNPKAYKNLEKVVKVYGAHGQQPNKNPAVKDVIDDEALVGLVDVPAAEKEEGGVKLEDDDKADTTP